MRHGLQGITKSLGAMVALLRLAQKHGDAVFEARIADYLEVGAAHDGWDKVSFADALNMATGIGEVEDNALFGADNRHRFLPFQRARTTAEKLKLAFAYPNQRFGPGEKARYRSVDTFVLAAAMVNFLKAKEGPKADLWRLLADEVYRPIGIFHPVGLKTREPAGRAGLPLLYTGLYLSTDAIAKISGLLQNGGKHKKEQILSPFKLQEALGHFGLEGLALGPRQERGRFRYHFSLRRLDYRSPSGGCELTSGERPGGRPGRAGVLPKAGTR